VLEEDRNEMDLKRRTEMVEAEPADQW